MSGLEIFFGVVLLLFSIAIVVIVLLQEGQQQNLDAITSGADTFSSKNKARSIDVFLSRRTKTIVVGLFVMMTAANTAMFFTRR